MKKEIRWLLEEKYGGKMTPEAEQDIQKLEEGVPLDYLIGFVNFLGCRIDLSYLPFIPRPETEYWVEIAIKDICARSAVHPRFPIRALDLFSGSGCVGLAVLKSCPWAKVDFAEREQKFLAQIQKNAELNRIDPERFRILESDSFSGVQDSYDFILANPPYIPEGKTSQVEEQVLDWEPWEALFGGRDGLDCIRGFLKDAPAHLNEGGRIYMEFDSPQKGAIAELLQEYGYGEWEFQKDQYGRWRFVVLSAK